MALETPGKIEAHSQKVIAALEKGLRGRREAARDSDLNIEEVERLTEHLALVLDKHEGTIGSTLIKVAEKGEIEVDLGAANEEINSISNEAKRAYVEPEVNKAGQDWFEKKYGRTGLRFTYINGTLTWGDLRSYISDQRAR